MPWHAWGLEGPCLEGGLGSASLLAFVLAFGFWVLGLRLRALSFCHEGLVVSWNCSISEFGNLGLRRHANLGRRAPFVRVGEFFLATALAGLLNSKLIPPPDEGP